MIGAESELVFKALSDARRRTMIDLLKQKPRTTGELCGKFSDLDRCTVMQHLGILQKAKIVVVKRDGRIRWNHLNVKPIKTVYDRWFRAICGEP